MDGAPVTSPDHYRVIVNHPLDLSPSNSASSTSADTLSLNEIHSFAIAGFAQQLVHAYPYGLIAARSGNESISNYEQGTGREVASLHATWNFTDMDLTADGRYLYIE